MGEGRIGYACDVYMEVYFLRSTIFLGRFHTYGYYSAVPKGRRIDEFPTKLRKIIQMSARIAHIYAPSYRAVCASMSNENELVTSLAQNRTDDLGAPFAHLRRSALHPSLQCTASIENEKALCCKTQAGLSHGTLMTDLRV